ncbi:leucine-tRNA ligase [Cantharellus anzutake]|uniref:leucine-tRNA ligase n=1 Tax=Cantharellus anzutake TaxID=1750568 RepID=UPI0019068B5E|nr:leucine-tRNA ligase [Cantharellus anzutake]KAF8311791.1 leucine-tRNA ligase [Cantharellus anzutake]
MANTATDGPIELQKARKRDFLVGLEKKAQARWASEKLFEIDAPFESSDTPTTTTQITAAAPNFLPEDAHLTPAQLREKYPKWLGTFPFPYMNGSLHLGHGFTISKVEFATGYQRMLGKRALFPAAFHCTGMPIKAAADKLAREMELFGPDFLGYKEEEEVEESSTTEKEKSGQVGKATKGKVNAKSTGLKYQFQIMLSMSVPREEIKKFADPVHWLGYFPPITINDLTNFGARIDWRRSFITTSVNPYFDSFVRWQINKLRSQNRIKFGERYTVYSPKDQQPCMDHDRSAGEALGPQEYTALKMQVVQFSENALKILGEVVKGRKVYLVAATLRPETMYGQTNCFVGPSLKYGLFATSKNDGVLYVCTHRAARNMAYQGVFETRGVIDQVGEVEGKVLVGTKIKAPFGIVPEVYVLPMDSVLSTKGTGVVTSVPSDSPDDFQTLTDLRKKPTYYGIDASWCSIDPIPVISTPTYGNLSAPAVVAQLKIQSQKDAKQLGEAKEIVYKEGFYSGTMIVGDFKGEAVQEAKPKVRKQMIEAGLAFAYAEPEGLIVSRSGEECVVSMEDQWYLDYGEREWKEETQKLLEKMETYSSETRHAFEGTLGWLHQWACARSFGLGTRLPWDQQYLVESLSDSTIYMSYYTIAHLLQGHWYGDKPGLLGIQPEQLTDEVWDHILLENSPFPSTSTIPHSSLSHLRSSLRYFYPLDLRSSGKDLIPNHLTFALYNHVALFPDEYRPQSFRINGHLMLNGKKMSKSTGNSLTLREGVEKFGADATRIALADAGDGIEDANFDEKTANATILRLHTLIEWCQEMMKEIDNPQSTLLRRGPLNSYHDIVFQSEIFRQIGLTEAAYEQMNYKEALKEGFFEMQTSRDWYREVTSIDIGGGEGGEGGGSGMHASLIELWIRTSVLLVTPIAPHFAEFVWTEVLREVESVQKARFPVVADVDGGKDAAAAAAAIEAGAYMRNTIKTIRDAEILAEKKKKGKNVKGGSSGGGGGGGKKAVRIFVATKYPEWQDVSVQIVKEAFDEKSGIVDDEKVREALTKKGFMKDKKVMPFVQAFKTLKVILPYLVHSLGFAKGEVITQEDGRRRLEEGGGKGKGKGKGEGEGEEWKGAAGAIESAEPGQPGFQFYGVQE